MKKNAQKILNTIPLIILVALIMATVIPVFLCDSFRISGNSMSPTLMSGDKILVNKLLIGARIYRDFDFNKPDIECFRMPGIRKVAPGDILVFNSPDGRYNDKISFSINYVYAKRCIGVPGDTIRISDGFYFNNSIIGPIGPVKYQQELSVTPDSQLRERDIVVNAAHFAGGMGWTIRNFGPLYIPGRNSTVQLDSLNTKLYAKIIQYETGYWPDFRDGETYINGVAAADYHFKEDYYFVGGDNVMDSRDSRYVGFVPEKYIVGIASRILYSKDHSGEFRQKRFLKGIRYRHPFSISEKLESALLQAGDNKHELAKALNTYLLFEKDSLKLDALIYLIENMPGCNYYVGAKLDEQLDFYRALRNAADIGQHPNVALGEHKQRYPDFSIHQLDVRSDLETVDSAYIVSNVEWAFKMWREMPWGSNVSFDDFKEYVLPYRIGNEALSNWREDYYNEYRPILEEFFSKPDSVQRNHIAAASFLNRTINPEPFYSSYAPPGLPNIGPKAAKYRCGTCRELTDFNTYLFRAFGIPCAVDYMPLRGDNNTGHSWTALWNEKNVYCEDSGKIMPAEDSPNYSAAKLKVYRTSTNKSPDKDVTEAYSPYFLKTMEVPKSLIYPGNLPDSISIALTRRLSWVPVVSTPVKGRRIKFHNVATGSIVRLLSVDGEEGRFWSDPFYVDSCGVFHKMAFDENYVDMILFGKYPLGNEMGFRRRMVGGVFEASNNADFIPCDTLHIIKKISKRLVERVPINSEKEYRYLRYRGRDSSWCQVAELEFFDKKGHKLEGRVIGTPGCRGNDGLHEYTMAFDGKSWTSFDYKDPFGGWTGMDFGKAVKIGDIHYSPANRDNCIRIGDEYELYYCDKNWRSAGRKVAVSDSLIFENVPSGMIYLLYDHTRGEQRRIFSYENDCQVWR